MIRLLRIRIVSIALLVSACAVTLPPTVEPGATSIAPTYAPTVTTASETATPSPLPGATITGDVNLALHMPVTASQALPANPPESAVDGDSSNWWGAGEGAPQWIQIDLQAPATIKSIRLTPGQSPDGETVHRVLGRGSGDDFRLLHEFSGITRDGQAIVYAPPEPWQAIRFVRIETVTSPSWVSWREIEVIGISEAPLTQVSLPPHPIATRLVNGKAEFYNRETGQRFIPIGVNFLDLGREKDYVVDRLFAQYNSAQVGREMDQMQALGYNVIRIALDICREDCIGQEGGGLRGDYLDHIADFLRKAKEHNLFVIIQANDLPLKAGYVPIVEATCCDTYDGYINTHYLSRVGVEQWKRYWQEVIRSLIERQAPLDTVMAYEIRGELFLFEDKPPLSLTSGSITTANGKTYDMADPAQKKQMIEEGVRYWADTISASIRELDPTALTVLGFFPPNHPNIWRPGDPRYVPPMSVFTNTTVDFLDLHNYPGYIPLEQFVENYGVQSFTAKPFIMGEFGGFKFVYSSPQTASRGLQNWQVESCKYNFQGWIFWHWTGTDDHEVWTGSEGAGVIRQTLAPANRPDPCIAREFDFFENNLALNKPVRVSRFLDVGSGAQAVDGRLSTSWQSGAGPTQWIEVNLKQPFTISVIRLFTSQYPEGDTVHQILVAGPDQNFNLIYEFRGFTRDEEQLEYTLPDPIKGIQFVRVVTLSSPSWVSWREVEILGK